MKPGSRQLCASLCVCMCVCVCNQKQLVKRHQKQPCLNLLCYAAGQAGTVVAPDAPCCTSTSSSSSIAPHRLVKNYYMQLPLFLFVCSLPLQLSVLFTCRGCFASTLLSHGCWNHPAKDAARECKHGIAKAFKRHCFWPRLRQTAKESKRKDEDNDPCTGRLAENWYLGVLGCCFFWGGAGS